jgi:hypothetical protein
LYGDKINEDEWAGRAERMEKTGKAYRISVGELEVKKQLGTFRCRWQHIFKSILRKYGVWM